MSYLEQYRSIADDIIRCAKRMYAMKYEMGDGGNMSVRLPGTDYMMVKGSNVAFCDMTYDSLVITDFDGRVIEGTIKPSKESLLHGVIYKNSDVGAIMHCHSPFANAWAANHSELEFSTYHSEVKLKGYCPVFDAECYVVPQSCFPAIIQTMKAHPDMNSFILKKHGPVAFGKTIDAASYTCELIEETAEISLLSRLG